MFKLNITDLCSKLDTDKSICPKCNKGKLWVKDSYFRCFKPNCNTNGDSVSYTMILKNITYLEALKLLQSYYPDLNTNKDYLTEEQKSRRNSLAIIYNICKQYKYDSRAVDYLVSRGLNPDKIDYGFWPINSNGAKDLIQLNTGFKLNKLKELKLVNDKNQEVFANRIIFPIRNINGNIVYYQGRTLNNEDSLRWLTSSNDSKFEESVFSYFYNTNILSKVDDVLFVCEGITDALSLEQLGLNVISSLNLYPPLFKYNHCLDKVKHLVLFYDNDKHNINLDSSTFIESNYKSWNSVLDIVIDLKFLKPELEIYCVMPPETTGITDINEWLLSINFDKDKALNYIKENILQLEEFLIHKFLSTRKEDIHKLIGVSLNERKAKLKDMLAHKVDLQYNSWIDYIIN